MQINCIADLLSSFHSSCDKFAVFVSLVLSGVWNGANQLFHCIETGFLFCVHLFRCFLLPFMDIVSGYLGLSWTCLWWSKRNRIKQIRKRQYFVFWYLSFGLCGIRRNIAIWILDWHVWTQSRFKVPFSWASFVMCRHFKINEAYSERNCIQFYHDIYFPFAEKECGCIDTDRHLWIQCRF